MELETISQFILLLFNIQVIGATTVSPVPWETPYVHPYFDNTSQNEITATVGQAALLHCRVRNLGDRAVSWIRHRDLHILTIAIMTYTNDQRFQSMHMEGSEEWTLKMTSAQPRDSGTYQCQVSTEPKISQEFRLTVVVAKAKILANSELFFKTGSDINLTCVSLQSPQPPSYIYWYKDGYLINYSQRGGINVMTERQTRTSKLIIARANPSDSGNYSCSPSNSNADSIYVHVIKSEHQAAMQHANHGCWGAQLNAQFILIGAVLACAWGNVHAHANDMHNFLEVVAAAATILSNEKLGYLSKQTMQHTVMLFMWVSRCCGRGEHCNVVVS